MWPGLKSMSDRLVNARAVAGHNQGPVTAPTGWQRHCWKKARAALLPRTMPIEVIRARVRRAGDLGLDVTSYASFRAASGHDLVALLFSSNALRMLGRAGPAPERVAKLARLSQCRRTGLAIRPLTAEAMAAAVPQLEGCHPAPEVFANWGQARAAIRAACAGLPSDRVLLISEADFERPWAAAGGLAGRVSAERYFATSP